MKTFEEALLIKSDTHTTQTDVNDHAEKTQGIFNEVCRSKTAQVFVNAGASVLLSCGWSLPKIMMALFAEGVIVGMTMEKPDE